MKKLGISVYPEKQDKDEIINYIDLAKKYSFSRLFTSLLQVNNENKNEVIDKMTEICNYAKNKGFDVVVDISPAIFQILDIKLPDTSFFDKLGATTIRLDANFDGLVEKEILKKSNLNLEINITTPTKFVNLLEKLNLPKDRLFASHNFYPQMYSGIGEKYFLETTKNFKHLGYKTAAFITSKNAMVGP